MSEKDILENNIGRLIHSAGPELHLPDEKRKGILTELTGTGTFEQVAGPKQSIWRRIMKIKLAKLAAAAIIIVAAVLCVHYFGGSIEVTSVAFADVIEHIRMAQTVECTITVEKQGDESFVMHYTLLEPSRMRIEASDGTITVVDTYVGKSVTLRPTEKKAFIMSTTIAPKQILNIYQELKEGLLKDFPNGSEEAIGQAEIDGRPVVGFLVEYNSTESTIWADAVTGVPVQIESVGTVRSETTEDSHGLTVKTTVSDLIYGLELGDSLFSLIPPEGYTVELVSIPASTVQDQIIRAMSARAMLQIAKACLDYAQAHNGRWPENLRSAIEFGSDDEALLNLTDPERQLGCVYIRPMRMDPRLVLLYEAYETWPEGGINVSFVDCHTTRIPDEATLKKHLELSLSQASMSEQ